MNPRTFLKIIRMVFIAFWIVLTGNAFSSDLDDGLETVIATLQTRIPPMMQQVDVPGLSIAIIHNSEIVWTRGFGITDYETQNPVTENTIFEAGSLSKPVFAYAVLRLAEVGLIEQDKSLSSHLPVSYVIDERIDQITARRILNHTSGFPLWWPENESLKIHFSPGERFSYSSEGYVYLQNIIEAITEKSLPELMEEQVFEPLSMTNSSYVWNEKFEKHVAFGHNQLGREETPWKRNMANAASSLLTSVSDYAKFVIALLNEDGLKSETLNQMLNPQIRINPSCIECIDNQPGVLSESLAWGLGWGLHLSADDTLFWHWADNLRFTSFCIASRDSKSGVIFFSNGCNGLTLGEEIVGNIYTDIKPIFDWLRYDPYDSPAMVFRQTVLKKGTDEGLTTYFELKRSNGNRKDFISENSINELGYVLLNIDRVTEAIDIFRLNVEEYPGSWNVYDSLAEAYAATGDRERAINYYKVALGIVTEKSHKKRIEQTMRQLKK